MLNSRLARIERRFRQWVVAPARRQLAPEVDVPVPGGRLRVDLRDRIIGSLLFVDGDYEAHVRAVFEQLKLEGAVCVDVGANIGLHTVFLSRAVGPRGRVVAFEPEQANFRLLEHNVAANGLANVEPHRQALSDAAGELILRLDPENFGNHQLSGGAGGQVDQRVETVPGDAVLAGVSGIGLIKIDVQGHEMRVLRGLEATLARSPSVVLSIEVSPPHLRAAGTSASELVAYLRHQGFDGYEVQPGRVLPLGAPEQYEWMNYTRYADLMLTRDRARLQPAIDAIIASFR